jgi:hypothetical protein
MNRKFIIPLLLLMVLTFATIGHAGEHQIVITVDPGEHDVPAWIAQQRLELTGAMRLLGDDSIPTASSVRIGECDQDGRPIAAIPFQFDIESKDPLIGTVTWPVAATTKHQRRFFRLTWSDAPPSAPAPAHGESPLTVSANDGRCTIGNAGYQVTHDSARGGLWTRLKFLPSGRTNDQTVWRDALGEYELRHDAAAKVSVLAAGPLRAVVEVSARYLDAQGSAPPSHPRATYRYTYLAGLPFIRIDATVEQDQSIGWPELRIGDIRPDTSFFTEYWMDHFSGHTWKGAGDLKEQGSFTTLSRYHGILIGDGAYFALAGPKVRFWDAGPTADSYLRTHWQAWRGKRMQYGFYALLDGSADGQQRITARRHAIQLFTERHVQYNPPRIVLDVDSLRQRGAALLRRYHDQVAALTELAGVREAVANFALRSARSELADAEAALDTGAFMQVANLYRAVSAEAAALDFTRLTWQSKVHHDEAQGLEAGDLLIILNQDVALALDREQFKLRGLYSVATKKEFVAISGQAPPVDLVGVTLLTADHAEVEAYGFDEAERSHQWRKTDDGIELVLRWRGVNVPNEAGVVDVEATISATSRGLTRWSCSVTNRSRELGLRYIKFPVIGPLHAGTEQDPTDYSASGRRNPTAQTSDSVGYNLFQCQAYYGAQGGVYYLPRDAQWYEKRLSGRADAATRTATFEHTYITVNSHGKQVKSFAPTYDTVLGVFEGDWYDVARRYRRWATRQPWCATGTIARRDDLPQWFKEIDLWLQGSVYHQKDFANLLQVGRNFGGTAGVWVTHWMQYGFDAKYPDYFPPMMGAEPFRKAVARGHKLGQNYVPYINAFLYATNAPSYTAEAGRAGARFLDGTPSTGVIGYQAGAVRHYMPYVCMCPATKFWQNKVAEMGRKLIREYGCDGIYYDQVGHFQMECGDPAHGHPLGGGNSWTAGVQELYDRVRRESAAAGKKVVFSSEFFRERYIGEVTVPLQQFSTHDSRDTHIRDVVYHDYVSALGFAWGGRPFVPFAGSLFIHGMPGPTGLGDPGNLGGDAPNEQIVRFLHYLSDCRRRFALKYINHGARLRNPKVLTELPMIDRGAGARPMPAVITSAWEAGDGDIGCFFLNISDEQRTVEYEIDLGRFALDSMGTYNVTRHELSASVVLETENKGTLRRADTLAPATMILIEFSGQP